MSRTGLMGLFIALLIPFIGYIIVKHYGKNAAHIPRKYFYDDVVKKPNGETDTLWHRVSGFNFTNQLGKKVTLDDIEGKAVVMNFFFTRCPSICPKLTLAMKKLQEAYTERHDFVHFISISVDPEHDSVPNLRKFADRFGINHDNWWFVTGSKEDIYNFALGEMKANVADPGIDTAFIHTEDFFLLDRNRIVRGWYSGFDSTEQAQLARDISTLNLERRPGESTIARQISAALPAIITAVGLIIAATFIYRSRKKSKSNA